MLPFSTCAAMLGFASFIRPAHLLSVVLICAGGFLPAAHGQLKSLASSSFWQQRAVRYVLLGEFLICCYNLILHQATFFGMDTKQSSSENTFRFLLVSRAANGMSCMCLFLLAPSLRCHTFAIRNVSPRYLAISCVG